MRNFVFPARRAPGFANQVASIASGLVGVIVIAGCSGEPPIVTYQIPTKAPVAFRQEETRTVAAIVPESDQAWFFKISGPQTAVDRVADSFRSFVENVSFDQGVPVLDNLPPGWRRGADRAMRYATIDIDTPEKQLDLSVSKLGWQNDWPTYVADNVNRWRNQVGLDDSDAEWAGADVLVREKSVATPAEADAPSIWVDVTGRPDATASPMMGQAMAPMMSQPPSDQAAAPDPLAGPDPHAGLPTEALAQVEAARQRGEVMKPARPPASQPSAATPTSTAKPTATSDEPPLVYEAPADWRPGRMSMMRMAAFDVGPTESPAEVTVISAGGDLRGNVARWMGQVLGKEPEPAAVDKTLATAEKRTVSGRDAQRFVLLPESIGADSAASAIDATIVPLSDGFSLFVKMTGPADVVGKQSKAMGTFLDSLRLKQ